MCFDPRSNIACKSHERPRCRLALRATWGCPVRVGRLLITQEEIKKQYDVRVTVVGSQLFATAILSQEHEETTVDWRKGSRPDLQHERIDLPREVEEKCFALMKRLNLRYGAIDLVCDLQGKLWFLEINPNGQWAWIENLTGYPIAAAIVDELEDIARCQS